MTELTFGSFEAVVRQATGHPPYAYQARLADEGLPDLLCVPTGTGKTLAAILPWLYRRRWHPDSAVRDSTPRRLVVVLPQRSLVEQTVDVASRWFDALGVSPLGPYVLMGGEPSRGQSWQRHPERDSVLVGTQDMVLSRLLMRGYAEFRSTWPIPFGVLHADTQFVFDEVQLMGPGLPTSLQLDGLRAKLGTAAPCRSMWMSATIDEKRFNVPDFRDLSDLRAVELNDADRAGPLRQRLVGTRTVGSVQVDPKTYARSLAQLLIERHTTGTRTIAVLNTVERATQVYDALVRYQPEATVVLLHSRFRPGDRRDHSTEALSGPEPAGTIVVATQVLEAGIDTDSQLMLTELAPWSSIVQRAGRCNRAGDCREARLIWVTPPPGRGSAAPYAQDDLDHAGAALTALDGVAVTTSTLQEREVRQERPLYSVLRQQDLFDLFDTAPDLYGNDIDVTRWIRDADTVTVSVAWRALEGDTPPKDWPRVTRDELCPAPIRDLRELLSGSNRPRRAWVFDQTETEWRNATRDVTSQVLEGVEFLVWDAVLN